MLVNLVSLPKYLPFKGGLNCPNLAISMTKNQCYQISAMVDIGGSFWDLRRSRYCGIFHHTPIWWRHMAASMAGCWLSATVCHLQHCI